MVIQLRPEYKIVGLMPAFELYCVLLHCRLTLDFQINKKIAEEVALIPSKRTRNKIAGFITVGSNSQVKSFFVDLPFVPANCVEAWQCTYLWALYRH